MKVLVIVMHYIVNGRFEDLNQINHKFLDYSLQKCIYPLSMKNVLQKWNMFHSMEFSTLNKIKQ